MLLTLIHQSREELSKCCFSWPCQQFANLPLVVAKIWSKMMSAKNVAFLRIYPLVAQLCEKIYERADTVNISRTGRSDTVFFISKIL